MQKIDARGLSCPQPVLLAQQALKADASGCEIIIDHPAARANVTRYAVKAGYSVTELEEDGDIILTIKK